jgi:hypothetical protein
MILELDAIQDVAYSEFKEYPREFMDTTMRRELLKAIDKGLQVYGYRYERDRPVEEVALLDFLYDAKYKKDKEEAE